MATSADELKAASAHLRGTIGDELALDTAKFEADAIQLLKFHGVYQQDDRDRRRELTQAKEELAYSCMVRASVPGGVLTAAQWAGIDDLADEFADGALRLTTRQGVQYHFVHKGQLKQLIAGLNRRLVSTYAACGDVVRNVMATTAPYAGRDHERVRSLARALDTHFTPRSGSYWELWVDGERAVSSEPPPLVAGGDDVEPIYGATYLPRKFKIGIALPGDNSVDIYTHDVGIVPLDSPDGREGAVILAAGGLGRSHNDDTTFPRLADPLVWVPDDEIADVVEAIVTIFRDEGNRSDRKHARLKYVVAERGVAWLRSEVEARVGHDLADPLPLPSWGAPRYHLGWHAMEPSPDGSERWFLGVPVPTGRLTDADGVNRRSAIRRVLDDYAQEIRLTPHQDVLLCGISGRDRKRIEQIFAENNVPLRDQLSLSVISSMACPALPTCGQALGESERVLPQVTELLDRLLTERNMGDVRIETRMTGCPNGCARPYVAELGIVGRTKKTYDIWLAGNASGSRLAVQAIEAVPFAKLVDVLAPLFDHFKSERLDGEAFGDFVHRVGIGNVVADLPTFRIPGAAKA